MTTTRRRATKAKRSTPKQARPPGARRAVEPPARAKRAPRALSAAALATWTHLLVSQPGDAPRLRGLARALRGSPWRDVLDGEASYGPGNNADLHYWACSNPEGTVWLLQLEETIDNLEGFRNADDEEDGEEDDRDPDISVSEEIVAALQVPPGTPEDAAVRRLVRLWEKGGDGRVIELVTSEGVFDLTPPREAPRPQ